MAPFISCFYREQGKTAREDYVSCLLPSIVPDRDLENKFEGTEVNINVAFKAVQSIDSSDASNIESLALLFLITIHPILVHVLPK